MSLSVFKEMKRDSVILRYKKVLYIFGFSCLLYLLATQIVPVLFVTENTVAGWCLYFLFSGGGVLLFLVGFYLKAIRRPLSDFVWVGVLFILFVISAFVNYQYDLIGNIKSSILYVSFACVMILLVRSCVTDGYFAKFVTQLYLAAVALWAVACFVSVVQFLLGCSYVFQYAEGRVKKQGFVGGRLFGIFLDPNHAAIVCLVLIILGVYLIVSGRIKKKIPVIGCCIVCYLYYVGASSRTAYLCAFAVFCVLLLFGKRCPILVDGKSVLSRKRLLLFLVGSVIVTVAMSEAFAFYVDVMKSVFERNSQTVFSAVRGDVDLSNISNDRFSIWLSYISTSLQDMSFFFGRGYRESVKQINDLYPFSYIAISKYMTHNGFLLLYVSSVIFAAVLGIAFAVYVPVRFAIAVAKSPERAVSSSVMVAMALFLVMVVQTLFLTSIWYSVSFEAFLFWTTSAYVLSYSSSPQNNGGRLAGEIK